MAVLYAMVLCIRDQDDLRIRSVEYLILKNWYYHSSVKNYRMNSCCAQKSETPRPPLVQLIPAVSRPAPPWSAVAIIDQKMQELSSQHFAGKYLILLFYPYDFSFMCPTELIQFSDRIAEFQALGRKLHFSSPFNDSMNKIFNNRVNKEYSKNTKKERFVN